MAEQTENQTMQRQGVRDSQPGMSQGELQAQQTQDLPDREAMSLVEVGDVNLDATVVAPINANVDVDALVNAPINADVDTNVGVDVDALVNAPIDATVYAPINADVDVPVNVGGEQTIIGEQTNIGEQTVINNTGG